MVPSAGCLGSPLGDYSRLVHMAAGKSSKRAISSLQSLLRPRSATVTTSFCCILLAKAIGHVVNSDSRGGKIDFIPWWQELESQVAKGIAASRGGGPWSFSQCTAPVFRENGDSFREHGRQEVTSNIKSLILRSRIWSLGYKDSHVTRYLTLDKLFNLPYLLI